jgi:hypothetical protein
MGDLEKIKDIREKTNINNWLEKPIFFRNGIHLVENEYGNEEEYTYGDYVTQFTSKIMEELNKEQYTIRNVNEFRDDLIRFIYKYSDG